VGDVDPIRIELVDFWDADQIVKLYRSEGWWKDFMDKSRISELIGGSYLFALAIDISTGRPIGMGRVISDGTADAYIQDLVVLPEWRNKNAGEMIVSALIEQCVSKGISWIGLIAQPGTDAFYRSLGFEPMAGHVPMLYHGGIGDAGNN
jgi:ribosomal protein S18 acetylase RimI-like enzyme